MTDDKAPRRAGTEAEQMFDACLDNPGFKVIWPKNSATAAQYLARRVRALGGRAMRSKTDNGWDVVAWVDEPSSEDRTNEGWYRSNEPPPPSYRPVEEEEPLLTEEQVEAQMLSLEEKIANSFEAAHKQVRSRRRR